MRLISTTFLLVLGISGARTVTFEELIASGIELQAEGRYAEAETAFIGALEKAESSAKRARAAKSLNDLAISPIVEPTTQICCPGRLSSFCKMRLKTGDFLGLSSSLVRSFAQSPRAAHDASWKQRTASTVVCLGSVERVAKKKHHHLGSEFLPCKLRSDTATLRFNGGQDQQLRGRIAERRRQAKAQKNQSASGDATVQISVHIYNVVEISSELLSQSEIVTSSAFGQAGIELRWMEGAILAKERPQNPAEHRMWDSLNLGLRIYTRSMIQEARLDTNTLGLVITPETHAIVLFDRIREFASVSRSPIESVLGAAMAHELFHILTGSEAHSSTGIMRTAWSRRDMLAAAQGSLRFTSAEGDRLRTEIRIRAQQSNGAPIRVVRPRRGLNEQQDSCC